MPATRRPDRPSADRDRSGARRRGRRRGFNELEAVDLPPGPGTPAPRPLTTERPSAPWYVPMGFWTNLRTMWRTSLPFRTTLIAGVLTSLTVIAVALVMGNSIARDLFTTSLNDILGESSRADSVAVSTFDSSTDSDDTALTAVRKLAIDNALAQAPNAWGYAFMRSPAYSGTGVVLQDIASEQVRPGMITEELREAVRASPQTLQYQSITLEVADGREVPGIAIGRVVPVQAAGDFELYLVYSLEDSQSTLDFVQRTLAVSMAILVLLVALIVGAIMRTVIAPIRIAAQTSRKLAAGELEHRIPERSDDDIGTLARSFNDMADHLQQQIEQLENLSQVQQRFVSDVSHELRTPLTTIRLAGGIVYARRDEFDPTLARSAELLHDQTERFELLLNDLLEISRYDAGAVELLRTPNNLVAVADDVIGAMTQIALDHGEELVLVAPSGFDDSEFDARRVTRIVRNLIANAIEHGEGKPIVLHVDSNPTAVALSVRDYGVGMTEEQQARVFDRFWRADPSRKRTMGGSGLGLAISQEDAQRHEGWLEVWSLPGRGTSFRLTLPRRVGEPIVSSPLALTPEDAGAETYTVPVDDVAALAFSDSDVDTQPIELPGVSAGTAEDASAIVSATPSTSTIAIVAADAAQRERQERERRDEREARLSKQEEPAAGDEDDADADADADAPVNSSEGQGDNGTSAGDGPPAASPGREESS